MPNKHSKTFYLDHLGCAKNMVDSEIMIATLLENGYKQQGINEASIIIINTCGFIESAKKESLDHFFDANKHYPSAKIILTGCLAERYASELKESLSEAWGIFGIHQSDKIVEFILKLEKDPDNKLWLPPIAPLKSSKTLNLLSTKNVAFVKIAEGCNHKCSFCAIPNIRGNLRSKTQLEVISEIKNNIDNGVFEINLVSQDSASYGLDLQDGTNLITLLKATSRLEGNFWLRILYIHPDVFPMDILDVMVNDERILPYFDIPFQHFSSNVLKNMYRSKTKNDYIELVNSIRSRLPKAIIRSTFLLGFPGESDDDINEFLDTLKIIKIDWAGAFTYSAEEGTVAYKMHKDKKLAVSVKEAKSRQKRFEAIQSEITNKALQRFVGGTYVAIVEEIMEDTSLVIARIYSQAAEVDGVVVVQSINSLKIGDIINVKINSATGVDLAGEAI